MYCLKKVTDSSFIKYDNKKSFDRQTKQDNRKVKSKINALFQMNK